MIRAGNEKMDRKNVVLPIAASTCITEGKLVALNSKGYCVNASKISGLTVVGCAMQYVDNRNGSDGALEVQARRGAFVWKNDGTINKTHLFKNCYVSDAETVTITSTDSSVVGKIIGVDDDSVTVETF